MKALITSDTHYGFRETTPRILERKFQEAPKDIDVIFHAGDWISHDQSQWKGITKLFRDLFPKAMIIGVLGNHDYWNKPKKTYAAMDADRKIFTDMHEIYLLNGEAMEKDDIIVCGFNGWYHIPEPPSNDVNWMPEWIDGKYFHMALADKANEMFQRVMSVDVGNKLPICITHHGPDDRSGMGANPKYITELAKKFNIIVLGHSHMPASYKIGDTLVVNPGSHYNDPKYIIMEI